MKISIERAALLKALGHVQNVVERRNTIPILSNVLIDANENNITLVATDLDIEVSEAAIATVSAPGQVTAPAHTLYDIARKLPDGSQVNLQINSDGRLDIDAGRSHFTLPLLPSSDFPKMTADGFTHSFVLKAPELTRLIDKTKFAISTEETRYYLNGIYVHGHNGKLRAVATDGHRLALAEMDLPEGAAGLPGVIMPRKTIAEIRRLIDGSDADIAIGLHTQAVEKLISRRTVNWNARTARTSIASYLTGRSDVELHQATGIGFSGVERAAIWRQANAIRIV